MVTIRPAYPQELEEIWLLVCRAVAHMNALGNEQWGADYPAKTDYAEDIHRGELLAAVTESGTLAGVACVNSHESPEYDAVPWTTRQPALIIHRMAIDPRCQRQGIGKALFNHVEQAARQWGVPALRIDTYGGNDRMQRLIEGQGYQRVGEIHLHGRPLPFPCFEKALAGG